MWCNQPFLQQQAGYARKDKDVSVGPVGFCFLLVSEKALEHLCVLHTLTRKGAREVLVVTSSLPLTAPAHPASSQFH